MHNTLIVDRLDRNITALLSGADTVPEHGDLLLDELSELSRELRLMPSLDFQRRLLADLQSRAAVAAPAAGLSEEQRLHLMRRSPERPASNEIVFPTLFAEGAGLYRVKPGSYALSVAVHAVVLALLLTSGMWVTRHAQHSNTSQLATDISPYLPDFAKTQSHGGGGGGSHETMEALQGAIPKPSMQQITPPMIVRNEDPKLTAEPTVVLPPTQHLPQLGPLGDPMAHLGTIPSNGTGLGGGMGSGNGGGIGSGSGSGVGPGYGGGMGGGVYRVGGGVTAPRAIYDPDPDYSEEARKAHYQGSVILNLIIDPAGHPREIRIARSLGMGLDEKALEAVKKWRFEPALKDGRPVAVQVNVEVNFHLY